MNVTIVHHEMRIELNALAEDGAYHFGIVRIEANGEYLPPEELSAVLKAEGLAIERKALAQLERDLRDAA